MTFPYSFASCDRTSHGMDFLGCRVFPNQLRLARRSKLRFDPLRCPRCGGDMKIVAFVLDHQVVHAIPKHLRKSRPDPRALPEHDDLHVARPPP